MGALAFRCSDEVKARVQVVAEDMTPGESAPLVSGADIRTFLFADMRGYTRFTAEHGDDAAARLAARFAAIAREAIAASGGEGVTKLG